MNTLDLLRDAVLAGDLDETETLVRAALTAGERPERILQAGLIAAMDEVGRRYECGDYFVPEMLVAARAMQGGLALIKPQLLQEKVSAVGKIVIGTVQGDLHDIGKNLVGMMLEGAGFEVIDLGVNVSPEAFAQAVRTHQPDLIGMSALLTTTMPKLQATIQAFETAGLRGQVKVMVGGAPVTEVYAQKIGADGFAADAGGAANAARLLLDMA